MVCLRVFIGADVAINDLEKSSPRRLSNRCCRLAMALASVGPCFVDRLRCLREKCSQLEPMSSPPSPVFRLPAGAASGIRTAQRRVSFLLFILFSNRSDPLQSITSLLAAHSRKEPKNSRLNPTSNTSAQRLHTNSKARPSWASCWRSCPCHNQFNRGLHGFRGSMAAKTVLLECSPLVV